MQVEFRASCIESQLSGLLKMHTLLCCSITTKRDKAWPDRAQTHVLVSLHPSVCSTYHIVHLRMCVGGMCAVQGSQGAAPRHARHLHPAAQGEAGAPG